MAPFSSSNIFHHHSHLHWPPGICWWLPCVTTWKRASDHFKHIQTRLPRLWRNLRIITLTAAFSMNSDILSSYFAQVFCLSLEWPSFVKRSFWGSRQCRGWLTTHRLSMAELRNALLRLWKPKYSLCGWNLAWRRSVVKQLNRSLVSGLKVAAQSNDG